MSSRTAKKGRRHNGHLRLTNDADDDKWQVPPEGLSGIIWNNRQKPLLTWSTNATLPIALMVIAPDQFPTRSKALRAIRQKKIKVTREDSIMLGKADTRIFPLDVIEKRKVASSEGYPNVNYAKPAGQLPVVYEDDYMAIVNKPSGMIAHSAAKGGFDDNSVLRSLPHVLTHPSDNIDGALNFPSLVHRLDAATSGLLVIAKTHAAAVQLSEQFAKRRVIKTYTALLQGTPSHKTRIDAAIDDKPAVTEWKVLRKVQSTKSPMTLVEFRPLHGRKHQLRRHASQVLKCPIVGDTLYGSTLETTRLLLCATSVELQHPIERERTVSATIELPRSFTAFMKREEVRYAKYEKWMSTKGARLLFDIANVNEDDRWQNMRDHMN